MLLFAIKEDGSPISSFQAYRKKNYRCPDCGNAVRLRRGDRVHPHFYHFTRAECNSDGKSLRHLKVQEFLRHLFHLPKEAMEREFRSIERRADLVYESKKWIFEIQCSPLSKEEAKARQIDYESLGYEVIWLLDEAIFGKGRATPLEEFCQEVSFFYFFLQDLKKVPFFYEQRILTEKGRILWRSQKRAIDLTIDHDKKIFQNGIVQRFYDSKEGGMLVFKGSIFDQEELRPDEESALSTALEGERKKKGDSWGWIGKKMFEFLASLCAD